MDHRQKGRKFGRETKQRRALIRSLAESLIEKGQITTTQAKAKSLRPYVERIITKSRKQSVATSRVLSARLSPAAVNKLTKELGPKFASRNGGYIRIINLPRRISDGSKMATIKFVE